MVQARRGLRDEFLDDHRHLTQALARLREAVRNGDPGEAGRLADEVDRLAGPHMTFEEKLFYPALRTRLGTRFVDQLYHEHRHGLAAIRELESEPDAAVGSAAERARILEQVEAMLEHAVTCGSLLSRLDDLDPEEEDAMLRELLALREHPVRWTDRPAP